MTSGIQSESARTTSGPSLLEKVGPHAPKVVAVAAAVGLVAAFLPAVTVTLSFLGVTTSESLVVWRDWRGKLDMLGYLGAGAAAVMLIRNPNAPAAKKLATGCLVAAGVTLLLAVWLPLSISGGGSIPKELGRISIGVGCYLNVLAAAVLAAAAALQAKRANVF